MDRDSVICPNKEDYNFVIVRNHMLLQMVKSNYIIQLVSAFGFFIVSALGNQAEENLGPVTFPYGAVLRVSSRVMLQNKSKNILLSKLEWAPGKGSKRPIK